MKLPNIGEMWRPKGARVTIIYICVDIHNATIFKFERLDDGLRIKRDISHIAHSWEFLQ